MDEKHITIKSLIKQGEERLDSDLKEICKDHKELLRFAYELRKQDCEINWINRAQGDKFDRFTKAFLQ